MSDTQPRRVAVIGGGISGLAAAHRLLELDPSLDVTLFEASDRLGGVLRTERRHGYLLEHSADNFITNVPWALGLCRRVGLADALLPTRETNRRAMVVRDGRLYPVPDGFMLMAPSKLGPLITTPLLSAGGKLRLLAEAIVPRSRDAANDESLASFVTRRFGRETFERLVQPLVGGIYTADPEKLSLAATLPRFLEMERQHGSVIRAVLRNRQRDSAKPSAEAGARYSMFIAPREGMSALVEALAATLPSGCVRLNAAVGQLSVVRGQWQVEGSGQRAEGSAPFDAVILATPAQMAAKVVAQVAPELSTMLGEIAYAGSVVALVAYRREQLRRPLEGFGFVVPEIEHRDLLAVSYSSQKYDGRAPDDQVLLRAFLGGAARPDLVTLPDAELRMIVARELGSLLGVQGEPELFEIVRWPAAMPQYHVGHLDRIARIEQLAASLPHFALAGNAYHGVGIPHCIRSGELAAEKIAGREPYRG